MSTKKKLLIYAHYYTPDVASTGQILQELAEGMTELFDITVLCVVPSYSGKIEERYRGRKYYKEEINRVQVLRIRVPEFRKAHKLSRIRNILGYFFGAMAATLRLGRQDYVFAISQPPILGGLLGVWGKWIKHAKLIYNIQDFNPEQILAVNYSKNRLLLRGLLLLDKFSCKKSDLVITVGRDLMDTLRRRFRKGKAPAAVLINNWVDEKEIYPLPAVQEKVAAFRKRYGLEDRFVIMYSGNLGLYYDLENLFRVIERFGTDTVTNAGRKAAFVFVGDGSLRQRLVKYKAEHRMEQVVFIPYQQKEELIFSLNAADVHWCVNARGIKGVSCPSKYYGIAAVAKPVLGVLEEGSEIRCLIEQTGGGLCAEPGDYRQIAENISWFLQHDGTEELSRMGERSHSYLVDNLTRELSVRKYADAILRC